jgi:hypothetical protein
MNWLALSSARRPLSSFAFNTGHAWIMGCQISDRVDRSMMARRRSGLDTLRDT